MAQLDSHSVNPFLLLVQSMSIREQQPAATPGPQHSRIGIELRRRRASAVRASGEATSVAQLRRWAAAAGRLGRLGSRRLGRARQGARRRAAAAAPARPRGGNSATSLTARIPEQHRATNQQDCYS